jgi:1A family penicillin-binding protein
MVVKNRKKLRKKLQKSARRSVDPKKSPVNTKKSAKLKKIQLGGRKRGRPRKSWWYHTKKNWLAWQKKNKRNWRHFVEAWQERKHAASKLIGLSKGRGRPRKSLKVVAKSRGFLEENKKSFVHWLRPWQARWQLTWHWLLQLVGVKRRRGRPRKHFEPEELIEAIGVKRRRRPTRLEWRDALSFLTTVLILLSAWWSYQFIFADLPSVTDLTRKEPLLTTKILDRNGRVLFRIYEDENRTLVPLSEISPVLVEATLAIEDKDFYQHRGFSLDGIFRALIANIKGEAIEQGGSTITQQLVKNRLLTPERTLQRKLRELILAILAEGTYSKDEILEMYLNQVAYGGSTYGAEEAAWRYFHKKAIDLNLAEAALLAGLPQAPSVYSPFGANPELAFTRQQEVLRRMYEDGYITKEEWDEADNTPIVFAEDRIDIQAPHFVMYIKKLLAEQYGEEILETGGLEVWTTLDLGLQRKTEEILNQELTRLAPLKVGNGAALVTNPQTGEILAMVGSKDYFDFAHDGQVNVTMRPRQPGSSIKPLTYALALESGKTPATIIDDSPVVYQVVGSPPYAPKNYDGKFHGKVTLREALASSYNVPAVKTLAELGVNKMLDRAEEVGITTWADRSRFGLSLTLGGGEVTMAELSQLYGSFANDGQLVQLNPLLEVRNYKGEVLYHNSCATGEETCFEKQVFDPKTTYLITDILSDNQARTPAFGPQSVLNIPGQQVAVKTGTTNSLRDNWTIGYTTNRLVAVWVGNNDNTPMSYVASGITGASPIWNKTMRLLLDPENPHAFAAPAEMIEVAVCKATGTLPCTGCPLVTKELFVAGTQPTKACNPTSFTPNPEGTVQPTPGIL